MECNSFISGGTTGNYAFFKNPGDGGDFGTKENLAGLDCADVNNFNNRILDPVTADTTISYCFGTCDASCGVVTQHAVTFNVDTADITVGDNGMYLGGGMFGGSNAIAMSDADGDGIWSVTVDVPEGLSGYYAFYNSPIHHYDWGTKEDLTGLECGVETNYWDRLLDAVTAPTTIDYCFGTCEATCIPPDTTAPVITLVGANPQEFYVGTAYSELGATATDDVDGDLTASIVIDATAVDVSIAGSYSVT